ncbi:TPA: cysteine desulfurase [Patescibacteria group bacterium]|nr:cysteine desulfurase [Patescibacteria group bacterium]HCU47440.1 cysteine desulfurase [Patescibacteria group bacterium]
MTSVDSIKKQFPFFSQTKNGKPWAFLDNAASCQKPESVLKKMDEVYRTTYANVHRGIYDMAENGTKLYEGVRELVANFLGARSVDEIIFTKNTTEAINLAAYSLSRRLKPGDEILLTEMEHHANLVPWQQAALRTGAKLKFIPLNDDFCLDLSGLHSLLGVKTKIVALSAMSNVLGTVNDLADLIKKAHAVGAVVLVDAAQAAAHLKLNVKDLDCDLLAFSGHKIYGPSGVGVLYGKAESLNNMPPFLTGGHMIADVWYDRATWNTIPAKFEAGTPPIVEVIGLGAAVKFINSVGWDFILNHEKELTRSGLKKLLSVDGLKLLGPKDASRRGPVFSFTLDGVHAHDVAGILNEYGVAVRAGHHCTAPLHKKYGIVATTRASCGIYNTTEDIDRLVVGLERARKMLD